jgi:general secretion pathway protein G
MQMTAIRRTRKAQGFTLVEILIVVIILGILAAIVIPQFTGASEDARKSNMQSQLQTLRSQIELYKLQHRDQPPLLVTNGWGTMTSKSDEDRTTNAAGKFGPYMQSGVTNPLTNSSSVAAAAAVGVGWVYNEATGEIHGVNKAGAQSDDGN